MRRIESAQDNQKLLSEDVPALPVALARLKHLMLEKDGTTTSHIACHYW